MESLPKEVSEKLQWIVILFPGFITVSIIKLISDAHIDDTELVIYSVAFTFLSTILAAAVIFVFKWIAARANFTSPVSESFIKNLFYVLTIVLCFMLGIFSGYAATSDSFFRTIRSLVPLDAMDKESTRTPVIAVLYANTRGTLSDWEVDERPFESDKKTDTWVSIKLDSNEVYEGYPRYYSSDNNISQIYLSPACQILAGSLVQAIKGPGVVLYEKNIRSVSFVDKDGDCINYWYEDPKTRTEKFPQVTLQGMVKIKTK
jgi:Family of unknown function (DUF6338)